MHQNEFDPEHPGKPAGPKPGSTLPGESEFDLESSGFFTNEPSTPGFVKATTRYEILNEIGRGGMGIVYRAQDWQLHRHVAVKILRLEYVDRPRLIARFMDEARIMGTLQHPGIAHVYECGHCDDGRPFHAMMIVDGETLCSLFKQQTRSIPAISRWLSIFSRVCNTVAYAHSRGVVHLDLKPANIMAGEYGEVFLMDWGLARVRKETPNRNHTEGRHSDDSKYFNPQATSKKVQGTLEYMSPEQARGDELDQRTDVFCLGAILFEILTGTTIYSGDNRHDLRRLAANAHLDDALKRLDKSCGLLPLVRLTKRCLAANPHHRPADASVLATEMTEYQASRSEVVENDMTRFFELSLDLFCIAGFDGYFRRINSNFSRVLGYSDDELLGRPFVEFVHVDDREKTKKIMSVLLDGQPVVRFRNRYLAADGHYIEFEWTAKSIMEENMIFAVARIMSDSAS